MKPGVDWSAERCSQVWTSPFMGMVNNTEKSDTPMHELQALAFAIQELALYLDTHREDREALELYRAYQELYNKGVETYVKSTVL